MKIFKSKWKSSFSTIICFSFIRQFYERTPAFILWNIRTKLPRKWKKLANLKPKKYSSTWTSELQNMTIRSSLKILWKIAENFLLRSRLDMQKIFMEGGRVVNHLMHSKSSIATRSCFLCKKLSVTWWISLPFDLEIKRIVLNYRGNTQSTSRSIAGTRIHFLRNFRENFLFSLKKSQWKVMVTGLSIAPNSIYSKLFNYHL